MSDVKARRFTLQAGWPAAVVSLLLLGNGVRVSVFSSEANSGDVRLRAGWIAIPAGPGIGDLVEDTSYPYGSVDLIEVGSSSTRIEGWIGPRTLGLHLVTRDSRALGSFEILARPDVALAQQDESFLSSGFAFDLPVVDIQCVWMSTDSEVRLLVRMAEADCADG